MYEAQITVKYNKAGWKHKVLNYGYRAIDGGELKRITEIGEDGRTRPSTLPWPLNSDGTKKSAQTDDPSEEEFVPYEEHAWTGVPLS